jgi:hypothetical protein
VSCDYAVEKRRAALAILCERRSGACRQKKSNERTPTAAGIILPQDQHPELQMT